jgi:hypothetical protein
MELKEKERKLEEQERKLQEQNVYFKNKLANIDNRQVELKRKEMDFQKKVKEQTNIINRKARQLTVPSFIEQSKKTQTLFDKLVNNQKKLINETTGKNKK